MVTSKPFFFFLIRRIKASLNLLHVLTLTLLTWTIWRAPTNATKWRIGFNSAFKGLILKIMSFEFLLFITGQFRRWCSVCRIFEEQFESNLPVPVMFCCNHAEISASVLICLPFGRRPDRLTILLPMEIRTALHFNV